MADPTSEEIQDMEERMVAKWMVSQNIGSGGPSIATFLLETAIQMVKAAEDIEDVGVRYLVLQYARKHREVAHIQGHAAGEVIAAVKGLMVADVLMGDNNDGK